MIFGIHYSGLDGHILTFFDNETKSQLFEVKMEQTETIVQATSSYMSPRVVLPKVVLCVTLQSWCM